MKRWLSFVVLPVFLGLCGALLRATELAYSFDAQTGLYLHKMAATPVLMGLSVLVILVFAALSFRYRAEDAPKAPESGLLPGGMVATVALLACAGFQIYRCITVGFELTLLIQALFSLYAATAALALAKNSFSLANGGAYAVLVVAPVFWLCFTLILIYRDRIADPILLDYSYLLFACISALLFFYALAGRLYGKGSLRICAFFGPCALFFSLVELLGQAFALLFPLSTATFSLSSLECFTLLFVLVFVCVSLPQLLKKQSEE